MLTATSALGALALIAVLLTSDARYGFGSLGFALGAFLSVFSVTAVALSAATALNRLRGRHPELSYQRWLPSAAFLTVLLGAFTVFALLSASAGEHLNTALLAVNLGIAAAVLAVAAVLMAASSHWVSTAMVLLLNTIALAQLMWLHEQYLSRSAMLLLVLLAVSLVLSLSTLFALGGGAVATAGAQEPVGAQQAAAAKQAARDRDLAASSLPARGQFTALWWFLATGLGIACAAWLDRIVRSEGPSPAEILTGFSLPPEPLSVTQVLTQWQSEPLGLVLTALLALWFLLRLRKVSAVRQTTFSVISFLLALGLLLFATQGPVGIYRDFLFSAASAEFLIIAVLVPLLLLIASVLTAPQNARTVRTQAPLLRLLASPVSATLAAAWLLFALWGIKWTVLFAHQVNSALFGVGLAVITAAALVMLALAAGKRGTLPVLIATLLANVVLGVGWYLSETLLLPHYYGAMGWPGQYPVFADQQLGIWVTLVVSTAVLMLLCGLSLLAKGSPGRSREGSAQEPALRDSIQRNNTAPVYGTAPQQHASLDDYDRQLRAEAAKSKGRE